MGKMRRLRMGIYTLSMESSAISGKKIDIALLRVIISGLWF